MSRSTRLGLLLVACAIVGGGFWQFATAQGEVDKAVQKWEYKAVTVSEYESSGKDLTPYGEQGWELVCVLQTKSYPVAYFKRPK